MAKTYLFYANSGDDSKDTSRLITFNGHETLNSLLAQQLDYDPNGQMPEEGDRLSEYKSAPDSYSRPLSLKERQGSTHHRPGPWVVTRLESYLPDLPVGTEFSEVVFCWCDYQPLPEEENPWLEMVIPSLTDMTDEALELMGLTPEQFEAVRNGERQQPVEV